MEEQNRNININPKKLLNSTKLFFSCKNIINFNKSIDTEYRLENKRKLNSVDKILNASVNNNSKILVFKKINFINKETDKNIKNKINCQININNISIPVNNNSAETPKLTKINGQDIKTIKSKIKKNYEIFDQKIDVSIMKEKPPKLHELLCHDYNLKNNNISGKYNETYEKLNKGTIPISFYGHIMTSENKINSKNNRNKYQKVSITQRNKNKLITIIYYWP